jgi:hypothetical protein
MKEQEDIIGIVIVVLDSISDLLDFGFVFSMNRLGYWMGLFMLSKISD